MRRFLCRIGGHEWRPCGHEGKWAITRRICGRCGRHEHTNVNNKAARWA